MARMRRKRPDRSSGNGSRESEIGNRWAPRRDGGVPGGSSPHSCPARRRATPLPRWSSSVILLILSILSFAFCRSSLRASSLESASRPVRETAGDRINRMGRMAPRKRELLAPGAGLKGEQPSATVACRAAVPAFSPSSPSSRRPCYDVPASVAMLGARDAGTVSVLWMNTERVGYAKSIRSSANRRRIARFTA